MDAGVIVAIVVGVLILVALFALLAARAGTASWSQIATRRARSGARPR